MRSGSHPIEETVDAEYPLHDRNQAGPLRGGSRLALIPPLVLMSSPLRFPFHLRYSAALLPGTHSVYSMFSVSLGILALALLGLGRNRTGLFLLGFAPAVHPTGGLWALGIGALAM